MMVFSFFGFLYRTVPGKFSTIDLKNSHLIDGPPKAEASVLYFGISALSKSMNCLSLTKELLNL